MIKDCDYCESGKYDTKKKARGLFGMFKTFSVFGNVQPNSGITVEVDDYMCDTCGARYITEESKRHLQATFTKYLNGEYRDLGKLTVSPAVSRRSPKSTVKPTVTSNHSDHFDRTV